MHYEETPKPKRHCNLDAHGRLARTRSGLKDTPVPLARLEPRDHVLDNAVLFLLQTGILCLHFLVEHDLDGVTQ